METAGKQVEDEELRELLKNNGIGRPSTRANIIETLFKRKYIEKKRKNLIATQTGIDLIDTIEDELLKSAELTGEWEQKLRKIEKGEYEAQDFKDELIEMVSQLTKKVIDSKGKAIAWQEEKPKKKETKEKKEPKKSEIVWEEITCPKCKTNSLMKGKTAIGCKEFKECGFKIPFQIFGKKLSEKQIQDLIVKGKTSKLKGFTEHPEKIEDGVLVLKEDYSIDLK
jgi:DNA topoisomerase-3